MKELIPLIFSSNLQFYFANKDKAMGKETISPLGNTEHLFFRLQGTGF